MSAKWNVIQQIPALNESEVQIWRVEIGDASSLIQPYLSLLTAAEQNIAARRRAGQVRNQFVFGRGCLRLLLGSALRLKPPDVPVVTALHGKLLTPEVAGQSVFYNIAHSKDTILIALRQHGAVGVDIEHVDQTSDVMEVALPWFTANETSTLASVADPEDRRRLFYRYWTRKEAIAKADGRGLLLPPTSFDVGFESIGEQPGSVALSSEGASKLYLVNDICLRDELAGALALESFGSEVTKWVFPLEALVRSPTISR
jgi:4'-phosphopantetheinyl transferase